jgi:hypothetical protein
MTKLVVASRSNVTKLAQLVCVKRARNALEGPKQLVRHVVQQSVPYKLALKLRAFNECLLYSQGEQKIIIVIVLGVIFAECGCITRVNETSKFGKESSDNAAISVLFVFWPRNYENLVAKNVRELGMFSRSIGPISALSHGFAKVHHVIRRGDNARIICSTDKNPDFSPMDLRAGKARLSSFFPLDLIDGRFIAPRTPSLPPAIYFLGS